MESKTVSFTIVSLSSHEWCSHARPYCDGKWPTARIDQIRDPLSYLTVSEPRMRAVWWKGTVRLVDGARRQGSRGFNPRPAPAPGPSYRPHLHKYCPETVGGISPAACPRLPSAQAPLTYWLDSALTTHASRNSSKSASAIAASAASAGTGGAKGVPSSTWRRSCRLARGRKVGAMWPLPCTVAKERPCS